MRNLCPLVIVLVWFAPASAAEIQLRAVCHVANTVVRLGEIADVYDEDHAVAEKLANVELCPAPLRGQRLTLTHGEIRDHLSRAGWNQLDHRVSGASEVVVHADEDVRLATAALSGGRAVPVVAAINAHRHVEQLLLNALRSQDGGESAAANPSVKFELTELQARFVGENSARLQLASAIAADTGTRQVELAATSGSRDGSSQSIVFAVHIEAPAAVVVASRTVPVGKIITHEDVELKYADQSAAKRGGVSRIEDVIGQESTTRLAAGQTLDARHVRRQILVRSGSKVTVFARNGGLEVPPPAGPRETGARGDVIWVEAPETRKKYSARIVELDTVEVFAQGAIVRRD